MPTTLWRSSIGLPTRSFRRHPWLPAALSLTRPQLLPGALAYTEWVLGVLSRAGWDPATTFTTHLIVFTFCRGMAMNLEMEAEAEAASGLTGDEWMAGQESEIAALVTGGRHPNFAGALAAMDFDFEGRDTDKATEEMKKFRDEVLARI